jgi:hypothetical protein
MDAPMSLPQKLYLLAYDVGRQRLGSRLELGYALRAAALVDLAHRGHLSNQDGRVQVEDPHCADHVLNAVLTQIAGTTPRSWRHWVRAGHRSITGAVQDQLHVLGRIDVRHHRRVKVLPVTTVTIPDLQPVLRITNDVLRPLGDDTTEANPDDRALLVLAVIAGLPSLRSRTTSRAHRQRINQFASLDCPAIPALRSVIRGMRAASSGGS